MDTVDSWLARDNSDWTLIVLIGAGVVLSGDGEHRPLWHGFVNLVAYATAPLFYRRGALRGTGRRFRSLREQVFRYRWPVAVAYSVLAGWFAQWHYDVPWFTVLHGTVSGIAAAYAARPLPAQETAVAA